MADDRLLYCAFGSNMSTRCLRDHRPAAEPVMPTAPGSFANLGGGIGTIQPAPGAREHGLPNDDIARIAGNRGAS